jgi:ABC-type sugar transport system ATPase subunit
VLERGRLQQVATPAELYEKPANRFVAGFIGSPPMNFGPPHWLPGAAGPDVAEAGVRPEAVTVVAPGESGALAASVLQVEALGHETLVHVHVGGGGAEAPARWVVREHGMARRRTGERIGLRIDPRGVHRFASDGRAI